MRRISFTFAMVLLSMVSVRAQLRAPATPSFDVELTRNELAAPATPVLLFQAITNPNIVDATSADHNAVVDGQAVVTRYDLTIYPVGSQTTPIKTVDIGKPTSSTTAISYTGLRAAMAGLPNGQYVVKLAAVGPGGTSATSVASDPFNQLGPPATISKPVVR